MVFIKDLKKEFIEQVLNKRVLVLVNVDVDALCGWKILQHLLHCENILYTVIPINTKPMFEESYNQHRNEIKNVILLNCGIGFDLVETLQPPEDAIFFIIDSLRPIEVHNVYNGVQIKIIVLANELNTENAAVPDFEDIFEQPQFDYDTMDNNDQNRNINRKADKEWELKRNKILFEYYKYTYHQCSSSLILFDLAWKMAKDNNDLLWWCILGLSDQYINGKIEYDFYNKYVLELQSHVIRLNHINRSNDISSETASNDLSINCLKISQINDLNMVLLRHWSVFDSIYHSIDIACLFKVWTNKGKKKLNEFLADLGLKISECKQKYAHMDSISKTDFKSLISSETIKQKYKYEENQFYLPTFIITFGFCNKLNAFDLVYILQVLLENPEHSKTLSDKFVDAMNCLNRDHVNVLEYGLELTIKYFKTTFENIQNMIDMNQVVSAGPFLQVFLEELNSIDWCSRNLSIKLFARYLLQAYLSLTKGKKVKILPLVICVRVSESYSLMIGVPPYSYNNNIENCFGLAFDEAAEKSKSRVNFNFFDTSAVLIHNEDRGKFVDALVAIMQ